MRVFVAGATGVLGRRLVAECVDRGHEVVGLSRHEEGDAVVSERGGRPHRGDLFDRESLVEGVEGADAVVHAATKIPTSARPSEDEWALNDRVRREGTRNLVDVAGEAGVDRFVQQSVVWVARQPDGSAFDEDAEPHPDRSTESALDAERIVAGAAEDAGFDPVVLRGGYFYAADSVHTKLFGQRLLDRRLPIVGRGLLGRRDATLSYLHVDDAGRAFADAVEGAATGTFHVVDDEPATYAAFLRAFADRLAAPPPRRIPAWLARYLIGAETTRLLSRSMPTANDRFRGAFGWAPEYPTYREGLDRVVAHWREEGVLRSVEGGYEWVGE